VFLGSLEQRRQQLPIRGLELGPLSERRSRLGDPVGELVANPLQIAEPEHSRRRGDAVDSMGDVDPRKALGSKPGKLALEPSNLGAQLSARTALVDADCLPDTRRFSTQELLHGLKRV
jgi:hypothetical protein